MKGNAGGGGAQGICAGAGNAGGMRPQARQEVRSRLISVVFTFFDCLLGSRWGMGFWQAQGRASAVGHDAAVRGRWVAGLPGAPVAP